jgi:hypothetical protein
MSLIEDEVTNKLYGMLNQEQKRHYQSILWMLGAGLGAGRSFLQAVCYITQALHRRREWFRIYDHNDANEILPITIKRLMDEYKINYEFREYFNKLTEFRIL